MNNEKEIINLFPEESLRVPKRKRGYIGLTFLLIVIFVLGFALSRAYGDIIYEKLQSSPFEWLFEKNDGGEGKPEAPIEDSKNEFTLDNIYNFDYSLVNAGEKAIIPLDLSLSQYGSGFLYNDTSFSPNIDEIKTSLFLPKVQKDEPLVLIIHTHATEAFSPENTYSYPNGYDYARSEDTNENIVAVGREMAKILNENGIKTLHCETLHDKESYKDSYKRSAETVKEYLKKYPTIKYVFDLHRDSITKSNGELVRPVTAVDGKAVAQIMCVVGTGENNGYDFDWKNNLSFAVNLRERLNKKYTNLARGTCLRPSAYNQHLAPVYILFEIGASGNSFAEAQNAVRLLANQIVEMVK